jgi:hypothetical protein
MSAPAGQEPAKRLPVTAAVGTRADVDNHPRDMPGKYKPPVLRPTGRNIQGDAGGSACNLYGDLHIGRAALSGTANNGARGHMSYWCRLGKETVPPLSRSRKR